MLSCGISAGEWSGVLAIVCWDHRRLVHAESGYERQRTS
jgi:hypothetical protein